MPEYNAPMRDIYFTMNELLGFDKHYASIPAFEDASPDLVAAILEESAKFSTEVLSPINQTGDDGCQFDNGNVTTPAGFKEAYRLYCEGGWPSLAQGTEFGGQGLPDSLSNVVSEINGSANWAWTLYTGLGHGSMATLEVHGTDEQKAMFMPKLVEGSWTGTMCLTEPHSGSDLSLLRTKAEPNADGTYSISGTKIFITGGEQDLTENIIHIVLARLPDAPEGTKGISLFIVPKINLDAEGNLLTPNTLSCGSIEHKMGIKGSATCVMNFDQAKGYLIGPANKGLNCMFTFMNNARLFIAQQGVCHVELAYQGSLAYAKDRLQMRSATGAKQPNKAADPIIVHADVRRMLLTQKSLAEGCRAFTFMCAKQVDLAHKAPTEQERMESEKLLALLIPIAKGFCTEAGVEAASLGVQILGGHGYIAEWGMEQILRDARIAPIYEGTNGIQALDLLGRKVLPNNGELLKNFTRSIFEFADGELKNNASAPFYDALIMNVKRWESISVGIAERVQKNPDELGAASFDYMMYSGYTILAYLWAKSAHIASVKLKENGDDNDFYKAKLKTAQFYFDRILPRNETLAKTLTTSADSIMSLDESEF